MKERLGDWVLISAAKLIPPVISNKTQLNATITAINNTITEVLLQNITTNLILLVFLHNPIQKRLSRKRSSTSQNNKPNGIIDDNLFQNIKLYNRRNRRK